DVLGASHRPPPLEAPFEASAHISAGTPRAAVSSSRTDCVRSPAVWACGEDAAFTRTPLACIDNGRASRRMRVCIVGDSNGEKSAYYNTTIPKRILRFHGGWLVRDRSG